MALFTSHIIHLHVQRNSLLYYGSVKVGDTAVADNENSLRQTLEFFLSERAKKMEDVKRLDLTIAQIKQSLGEPMENATEQLEIPPALSITAPITPVAPRSSGGRTTIRPDEFFGLQYSDAARNYLRKVGHAVGLEELLDALRNGGCKVGGSDPKRVLYISLVRNTRDFVPTGNGFIGLREFYPNLPKAKALINGKKSKRAKKSKRKTSAKGKNGKVEKSTPTPQKSSSNLKDVLVGVMKSGDFMDGKEILRGVEEKMGGKVTPITVYGILRSKGQFERNAEGKYRAVAQ